MATNYPSWALVAVGVPGLPTTAMREEMRELTLEEVCFVSGGGKKNGNGEKAAKAPKKEKVSKAQKLADKAAKAQAAFDEYCDIELHPENEEECALVV